MLQLLCFKAGSFSFHAPFFSITGRKMLHFSGKCLGKTFGILGMGSINCKTGLWNKIAIGIFRSIYIDFGPFCLACLMYGHFVNNTY